MSGFLTKELTACVSKSMTRKPLSPPFSAYILSVEPSGFFEIAIGEAAGLIVHVQAISLVCVSITYPRFVGAETPHLQAGTSFLLAPATTYLPSGVMYMSWMPPGIEMVLIFSNEAASRTSTPPLGSAWSCGKFDTTSHLRLIDTYILFPSGVS